MLVGWRPLLVGWRPLLVGWRPLLLGWRALHVDWVPLLVGWWPLLLGWRPLLVGWRAPSLVVFTIRCGPCFEGGSHMWGRSCSEGLGQACATCHLFYFCYSFSVLYKVSSNKQSKTLSHFRTLHFLLRHRQQKGRPCLCCSALFDGGVQEWG